MPYVCLRAKIRVKLSAIDYRQLGGTTLSTLWNYGKRLIRMRTVNRILCVQHQEHVVFLVGVATQMPCVLATLLSWVVSQMNACWQRHRGAAITTTHVHVRYYLQNAYSTQNGTRAKLNHDRWTLRTRTLQITLVAFVVCIHLVILRRRNSINHAAHGVTRWYTWVWDGVRHTHTCVQCKLYTVAVVVVSDRFCWRIQLWLRSRVSGVGQAQICTCIFILRLRTKSILVFFMPYSFRKYFGMFYPLEHIFMIVFALVMIIHPLHS